MASHYYVVLPVLSERAKRGEHGCRWVHRAAGECKPVQTQETLAQPQEIAAKQVFRVGKSSLKTVASQPTELPGMFHHYRADVSQALREGLSGDGIRVYDMLRYYLGWVDTDGTPCVATEGKALRPTLCLFACEATGGSVRTAMPAAVGLEFMHNFSLIHDDIQDLDETRHHRRTLWAVWGMPKALVAGNVLRAIADTSLEGLVDEGVDVERALAVIGLLTEAYLNMIEGQYLDLSYEGRPDIGLDDYMEMISLKTGALIKGALNLGALLGTRDAATVGAFRTCGRALGYAFQIRDDYLGVWGDEDATGKPVGADIRRKKNSFPVVYAMSQAAAEDRAILEDAYRKDDLTDEDVTAVLDVMDRVRVKDHAQSLTAEYCETALAALERVDLTPNTRQQMEELVHFLLVRQH